jgi:hypothetical protein
MKTEKTTYWVTLGVLALTFNPPALQRSVVDRIQAIADRVSDQLADKTEAVSAVAFDRGFANFEKSQAKLACAQTRLSWLQASMARRQADFARLEAERAQFVALQQARQISIACPRVRISRIKIVQNPNL